VISVLSSVCRVSSEWLPQRSQRQSCQISFTHSLLSTGCFRVCVCVCVCVVSICGVCVVCVCVSDLVCLVPRLLCPQLHTGVSAVRSRAPHVRRLTRMDVDRPNSPVGLPPTGQEDFGPERAHSRCFVLTAFRPVLWLSAVARQAQPTQSDNFTAFDSLPPRSLYICCVPFVL